MEAAERYYSLEIDEYAVVSNLHIKIENQTEIPRSAQRLVFNDEPMLSDETLPHYGIKADQTIRCFTSPLPNQVESGHHQDAIRNVEHSSPHSPHEPFAQQVGSWPMHRSSRHYESSGLKIRSKGPDPNSNHVQSYGCHP